MLRKSKVSCIIDFGLANLEGMNDAYHFKNEITDIEVVVAFDKSESFLCCQFTSFKVDFHR